MTPNSFVIIGRIRCRLPTEVRPSAFDVDALTIFPISRERASEVFGPFRSLLSPENRPSHSFNLRFHFTAFLNSDFHSGSPLEIRRPSLPLSFAFFALPLDSTLLSIARGKAPSTFSIASLSHLSRTNTERN